MPTRYYPEPDGLGHENRAVFGRTWQLVGRAEQVAEGGQFFTATVGDEPVLIVRGNDGELRAMSNVCRHRAGPVAKGCGRKPILQCGYHGWVYGLDGRLLTTPEMDGIECFDRSEVALPQFRVGTWNELVFVNRDPDAPPLRDYLGEMVSDVARHDYSGFRLAARKDWELDCN